MRGHRKFSVTRRQAISAGAGAVAWAASRPSAARSASQQPNVLFIMADDLGYADLSVYGRRDYQTPVLDGLAAQGMMFTHGYANSAVCSSTRVALITGNYQYRLAVGLEEPLTSPGLGLDPAQPTLPSLLKEQGYHTALIGKWHLGQLPDYGPLQSGYGEFWGNRGGGVDYFTHEGTDGADLWDGDVPIERHGYYTDLLADRSIDYLEARATEDRPWLLSLHFTAPHWPWEADNQAGRDDSARLDEIQNRTHMTMSHYDGGTMETYAAMVTNLDANIGRVLERLKHLDMERDTIVIFTSDNGGERFSDTWPFSGIKTELLEGGIRVPLIVAWPGRTTPGSSTEVPAMSMDFLPTVLRAAGGDPSGFDGVDLAPVLAGGEIAERTLYWRYHNMEQRAVRRGRYKYLKIGPNEFLFDVIADPRERANLKDLLPGEFHELKCAFEVWNSDMLVDPAARSYGVDARNMADHFD